MENEQKTEPFSNDQIARRKLLQIAAYVPPAILGVMIAGNQVAEADSGVGTTKKCKTGSITVSAGGSACCPCIPGDPKYNPTTCNMKRCQLGNCPSCGTIIYSNKGQCNSAAKKTPCACTCVQIGGGGGFWQMTGC